jgi:hypothetical protein
MRGTRTRRTSRVIAAALSASIALAVMPARANDPATAQMLFDQGRRLMQQKRFAEACQKLEESQRLDPAGGTLAHLALCRESEGRIATAWALWQDALTQAKREKRKERADFAQQRIDALTPTLPKIRVKVAPANRAMAGFQLLRDETAMGEAQWGEPIPVDPGIRVLTARATGHKTWTKKIDVPAQPQELVVEVPELEVEKSVENAPPPPPPTPKEDNSAGDTQRTLGFVAGGVGLAGIVVGSIFGFIAIKKNSEADNECRPPDYKICTPKGVEAGDDGRTAGNVSTVAFIAGGVFLAGGVALYFTAPSGSSVSVSPTVGTRGASVALTAHW